MKMGDEWRREAARSPWAKESFHDVFNPDPPTVAEVRALLEVRLKDVPRSEIAPRDPDELTSLVETLTDALSDAWRLFFDEMFVLENLRRPMIRQVK
jgi:hypothetical protein